MPGYDEGFYEWNRKASRETGRILFSLLSMEYQFLSVVDVGCGEGAMLAGALDIRPDLTVTGIDGDWIKRDNLMIPQDRFLAHDLTRTIPLDGSADLGMCLEVVEHLDPLSADNVALWLCNHSRLILFSAAIPGQGGLGHINERPMSYWIALFNSYGWSARGWLRTAIWHNPQIPFWYRQNVMMFEHCDSYVANSGFIADCVHPSRNAK